MNIKTLQYLALLFLPACSSPHALPPNIQADNSAAHGLALPGVAPQVTEYAIPTINSYPYSITKDSSGSMRFAEVYGHKIGAITANGALSEVSVPGEPVYIVPGPLGDTDLWFTVEGNPGKLGSITPGNVVNEFTFPLTQNATLSDPYAITAGPDGNLWVTGRSYHCTYHCFGKIITAAWIAKVTRTGTVTTYLLSNVNANPNYITVGPDRNLWFTEYGANKIGKITTAGQITEFPTLSATSNANSITAGPDGNLWVTENLADKIGKVTTAGKITEYNIPTLGAGPNAIAVGPDGNLWFTEYSASKIGKVTTAGVVTDFPLTANSGPYGISAGPNGTVWFTELTANKIGTFTPLK